VFHHIPKTGGSSVNRVLPCWFYRISNYPIRLDPNDWTAGHKAPPRLDLSVLRANDCLAGHWAGSGDYLHEKYPEILAEPKYRLFAFVRDPLELKLSLYFWEKRQGKDFGKRSIEDELLMRPNFLAARFPCTEDDYQSVLGRYFFIGFTESIQESFDRLAKIVGRARLPLPHVNRARADSDRVALSSDFRSEFKELNRLNYLVYDHSRSLLNGRAG
jgi:hypothetical protein